VPVLFILSLARIISRCLLCLLAPYENNSTAEPVAETSAGRSIRVVQRWFIRVLKNLERGLREKGEGDWGRCSASPTLSQAPAWWVPNAAGYSRGLV
jgi:hypothetical protein